MERSHYLLYLLIICIIPVFFHACGEEHIIISKPCAEDPGFDFDYARLYLTTDITSESQVSISKNGFFYADSIKLQHQNVSKNARIEGLVCKDKRASLEVTYNDTMDNSRLKIETEANVYNQISGKLYYCPDINNCSFTEIGNVVGYVTDHYEGFFSSPLFNGEFEIFPVTNQGLKK